MHVTRFNYLVEIAASLLSSDTQQQLANVYAQAVGYCN